MASEYWWIAPIVLGVYVVAAAVSFVRRKCTAPGFHVEGKHVFITGGSTGLGLAIAKQYANAGAKVSIVARRQDVLETARTELESLSNFAVFAHSCDVTSYESMESAVREANQFHDRVTDHVVCCAGLSVPGMFIEQDLSVFRHQVDVNYLGSVHTARAALPAMVERNEGGQVVFVSSVLAMLTFIGYVQYACGKYPLRGFAESLQKEMKLNNIRVSLFMPGNMDTEGYENENKTKPKETFLIEGASAVAEPDKVAACLRRGISNGGYAISNEILTDVLRSIANGTGERHNTFLEALLSPLLVVIQVLFGLFMDIVVYRSDKKLT